ncbi:MAG: helicase-associated domain-containing protein [Pontiellaceae bacterium]|nr:helicase-associated domain-containing protein [Pontiellaceae bacterium]
MKFIERINEFTTSDLQRVFRGLNRKCPSRKAEMVAELNRIWLNEPLEILDRMSEAERVMLADCVHEEQDEVFPERLKARHGLSFRFGYDLCDRTDKSIQYIQLFISRDYPGEYLLLEDVGDALMKHLPKSEALAVKTSSPDLDDLKLFESEALVFPELKRMLQLVAAGKLRVSEKTGLPSAPAMKAAATALVVSDDKRGPNRSFIWPVLLQQCGWARFRAGKFGLTSTGKALLEEFSAEAFKKGIFQLRFDDKFDEILQVSEIKGFRGRDARRNWNPAAARRMDVLNELGRFPVNEWVSMDDAYSFLVSGGVDCRVVLDGSALYICDREYGALYGCEWKIGKVYFRQLVCESLATLGLVDLLHREEDARRSDLAGTWGMDGTDGLTRYDGIVYIRLTPLGRFCLGEGETVYEQPAAEQRELFKVLPNHEIAVVDPAGFSVADSAQLERVARKVSDAVWKMDRRTIFAALENGEGEADILSVLEAGSANSIPEPVLRLIRETVARSGKVVGREEAVAVAFDEESTAVLVASDRSILPTVLGRNGAVVFVRAKNLKKFQGGLRKMGILLP